MYGTVATDKPVAPAATELETAVKQHRFGVLHVHDLDATLRCKRVNFADQCKVFEVCNPQRAAHVLDIDKQLNMALPCRISVYSKDGQTRIGMIRPEQMLAQLSDDPRLATIAAEVERATRSMIDDAC